jgi:4-amino-4-deoxy-L-arabinose transferase-like glycosyltransferase
LILAAALRLAHAGVESLWFDEAFTVIASRMNAASILRGEADPVLPPFYFIVLHVWQKAMGESELAVRAFSGLCSLLAVAVTCRLAVRLFGRRAGLWMAGLMAVSPFQIYYAQEARPYALIVLLSAGLLWVFVEALAQPMWLGWVGYVVLVSLGLYTHYFFGLVLVAMHLWAAIYRRRWATWRGLLIGDVCAAAAFLPHVGVAVSRAQAVTGGFWIERPSVLAVMKTCDFLLFAGSTPTWLVPLALFGTLGLLTVVGFDLARFCQRDRTRTPAIALSVLVIALPIAAAFGVSQVGSSIYLDRSFALLSPAYLALLALGLAARPRRSPSLVLAAALGLVAVISLAHFYFWPDVAKPRFREAGGFLVERAGPGDVLLNLHDSTYFSLRYYAPQVESYVLETDRPWLLPEAWPRFGVRVAADWVATLPAGVRLWVAIEPGLYDGQQQEIVAGLEEDWQWLERFEASGIRLCLFQKPAEAQ